MNNTRAFFTSLILVLLFILLFFLFQFLGNIEEIFHSDIVDKKGIEIVHQMLAVKVSDAEKRIDEEAKVHEASGIIKAKSRRFNLPEKIEKWNNQLSNNIIPAVTKEEQAAFQEFFSDTVFFGDSMTQAIGEYGLINSSRIVYKRSAYIEKLRDNISTVMQMYPKRIIIFTGLNDCSYYFNRVESYLADYKNMIQDIKKELPEVEIVICSLLPPNDALAASREDLAASEVFDTPLIELCKKEKWIYIDTKWMVRQPLYLDDGIHFDSSFYVVYMRYLYATLNSL